MKYYQQSLMTLANTRTQEEKQSIKVACKTFTTRSKSEPKIFHLFQGRSRTDLRLFIVW